VETSRLKVSWNLDIADAAQATPDGKACGKGSITYFASDPGLAYCRSRDADAKALVAAVRTRPLPIEVEAPTSLVTNLFHNPKKERERWIHLLNVSHLMPQGDTGYRGMNRPPARRETASGGAQSTFGSPLVPAKNIRLRLRDVRPVRARLAIAGTNLPIEQDGTIVVPEVRLHDVVVVVCEKQDQ